ncbi:hypothetical protein ACFQ2B_32815 [Streptomyces stramineus]
MDRGDRSALPLDVSAYCAQSCVELPAECRGVLESVRALHWVEAVIGTGPGAGAAPAAPAGPFRTALVSLGGLRAPHLGDWTPYPRLVVPAALEALAAYGVREVHVAGNLPAGTAEQIANGPASAPVRVTAGALSHSAFLRGWPTATSSSPRPGSPRSSKPAAWPCPLSVCRRRISARSSTAVSTAARCAATSGSCGRPGSSPRTRPWPCGRPARTRRSR